MAVLNNTPIRIASDEVRVVSGKGGFTNFIPLPEKPPAFLKVEDEDGELEIPTKGMIFVKLKHDCWEFYQGCWIIKFNPKTKRTKLVRNV